jgi:hypothetical protein
VPDVPAFLPSRNGLAFTNSWPAEPDIVVDVPVVGKIAIGSASNGLCGGMVFTVLDIFTAGRPPLGSAQPHQGDPLFDYIVRRLIDSWDIPDGILKYYSWMTTPDGDTGVWIATRRGVSWMTVTEEWPKVRADLDAGRPSPLGLVTVSSTDPGELGKNHQVLAYGYDLAGDQLTVKVYDPNTDRADADGVTLSLSVANATAATTITSTVNIGHPVRGFFRVGYTPADPSSLDH